MKLQAERPLFMQKVKEWNLATKHGGCKQQAGGKMKVAEKGLEWGLIGLQAWPLCGESGRAAQQWTKLYPMYNRPKLSTFKAIA